MFSLLCPFFKYAKYAPSANTASPIPTYSWNILQHVTKTERNGMWPKHIRTGKTNIRIYAFSYICTYIRTYVRVLLHTDTHTHHGIWRYFFFYPMYERQLREHVGVVLSTWCCHVAHKWRHVQLGVLRKTAPLHGAQKSRQAIRNGAGKLFSSSRAFVSEVSRGDSEVIESVHFWESGFVYSWAGFRRNDQNLPAVLNAWKITLFCAIYREIISEQW